MEISNDEFVDTIKEIEPNRTIVSPSQYKELEKFYDEVADEAEKREEDAKVPEKPKEPTFEEQVQKKWPSATVVVEMPPSRRFGMRRYLGDARSRMNAVIKQNKDAGRGSRARKLAKKNL